MSDLVRTSVPSSNHSQSFNAVDKRTESIASALLTYLSESTSAHAPTLAALAHKLNLSASRLQHIAQVLDLPVNDAVKFFASGKGALPAAHAILGRMAAYTGQEVTWEMALNSKEDLSPARYDWDAAPPPSAVAVPGQTPFR